jgi:hypothetical protein
MAATAAGSRTRGGFLAWAVVGAALGFGVIAILSIGIFFIVLAGVGIIFLAARKVRGVAAVFVGLATAPAFVAVTNRSGPGTACRSTPTTTTCVEQLNPWPWAAVAMVLVLAAAVFLAIPGVRRVM